MDPIYEYLRKQKAHQWLLFFNPKNGRLEKPNNIAIKPLTKIHKL